jgi:hypothetical protein
LLTVGAVFPEEFTVSVAGALHTLEATEFETHAISFSPL